MGHQRLGSLPTSKKWRHVVELISGGAQVGEVAAAASAAAELSMIAAANDPAVHTAFFLLTQIPLAARGERFVPELRALGLKLSDQPSLVEIVSALADAVDRHARRTGARTDFGEMVQLSAAESLNAIAGRELPSLFGTPPESVRNALGGLGTVKQFAVLARDFFSRLTRRHLDYYLSRELSKHVGSIRASRPSASTSNSRRRSISTAGRPRASSRNSQGSGFPSRTTKAASTR